MELTDYQEKPIEPRKIKAVQLKKSDAIGKCFIGMLSWDRFMSNKGRHKWVYSGDLTEEHFEESRKKYRVEKSKMKYYIVFNDKKISYKHNDWMVLSENGEIRVMNSEEFKEKYIKLQY